jgi:catechol 2,3-dioxygenase-like lactoylglutathione lyase family enzyme
MTQTESLKFMPIVHVSDMAKAVDFYVALGGVVAMGSRDGDWVQVCFGQSEIGLLAHPPAPGESEIELAFNFTGPLMPLQDIAEAHGLRVLRSAADEAFGEQLQLEDPDGRKVKINRIEADLIG